MAGNAHADEQPMAFAAAEKRDHPVTAPRGHMDLKYLKKIMTAEELQELCQGESCEAAKVSPISTHKTNYISFDRALGDEIAQVKFQFSVKFPLFDPNSFTLYRSYFPVYLAYTQKSLWNVGPHAEPVIESDYNPELFLDYPVDTRIVGQLMLRNIVISPLEHESNGRSGSILARSWNRQYLMLGFGLQSDESLKVLKCFLQDKARLSLKVWHAYGYRSERHHLEAIGSKYGFLDYMGRGEVGLSVRNFLWGGRFRDHQLDVNMPILNDNITKSFNIEFRQQFPGTNFALYAQYWYGYGETLQQFDQFVRSGYAGVAFSH